MAPLDPETLAQWRKDWDVGGGHYIPSGALWFTIRDAFPALLDAALEAAALRSRLDALTHLWLKRLDLCANHSPCEATDAIGACIEDMTRALAEPTTPREEP